MYKCLECGLKFEEPKIYTEDCSPASSLEYGFIQGYKGCPACEGDYIEICECDNCQEWFETSMLTMTNQNNLNHKTYEEKNLYKQLYQ